MPYSMNVYIEEFYVNSVFWFSDIVNNHFQIIICKNYQILVKYRLIILKCDCVIRNLYCKICKVMHICTIMTTDVEYYVKRAIRTLGILR